MRDPALPLRLTPVAEARAVLAALIPAPVAATRLPLAGALGATLAEPVRAGGDLPAAPVAARDGWAVAAAATEGAGPYAPLPLAARPVAAGEALPPGTDAVLDPFEVAEGAALVAVPPGEGVVAAGAEAASGQVLRPAGARLRPLDLTLAAAGIAEVAVRRPRVTILPCGDELLAGQPDLLGPWLAALATAEGALAATHPPLPDHAEAIAAALRAAAAGADLLLLTGGSGQGEADRGAAAIALAGRLLCHGLAARPGRTAGLGEVLGRPVLLLPGRAEHALAAWWWLARPALRRLAGATDQPPLRLRLAGKVASAVGLAELVPLAADGRPLAVGGLPLAALAAAAAILEVPPESEGLPGGAAVEAFAP